LVTELPKTKLERASNTAEVMLSGPLSKSSHRLAATTEWSTSSLSRSGMKEIISHETWKQTRTCEGILCLPDEAVQK